MFGGEFQPMSVQVTGSVACIPFAVALIAFQELDAVNLYSVHGLKCSLGSIIHYLAILLTDVLYGGIVTYAKILYKIVEKLQHRHSERI